MQTHDVYHHGDLRRALLDAAMQLVESEGIAGLTLRGVARQAGVSHAAPYHHFQDKSALVTALVIECFERFDAALHTAFTTTPGTALERYMAVGHAYVRFALDHPQLFRVMCRPELREFKVMLLPPGKAFQSLAPDDIPAFKVLMDSIRLCQTEGTMAPGDPLPLALASWAMVHGLVMLLLDGGLQTPFLQHPEGAAALADSIIRQGVAGIGQR